MQIYYQKIDSDKQCFTNYVAILLFLSRFAKNYSSKESFFLFDQTQKPFFFENRYSKKEIDVKIGDTNFSKNALHYYLSCSSEGMDLDLISFLINKKIDAFC